MIADLFVFAVAALALIGLVTVCEAVVGWMERRGWLTDELLPWEQPSHVRTLHPAEDARRVPGRDEGV